MVIIIIKRTSTDRQARAGQPGQTPTPPTRHVRKPRSGIISVIPIHATVAERSGIKESLMQLERLLQRVSCVPVECWAKEAPPTTAKDLAYAYRPIRTIVRGGKRGKRSLL